MPVQLPPYSAVLTDSEHVLWVVLSAPGDKETLLRAAAPDGNLLGDVRIPMELHVFEVGRDYVLGTYESKDAIPYVALFRLHRGR